MEHVRAREGSSDRTGQSGLKQLHAIARMPTRICPRLTERASSVWTQGARRTIEVGSIDRTGKLPLVQKSSQVRSPA